MLITESKPALNSNNVRTQQYSDAAHSTGRKLGILESYYSKKELTLRCAALVDHIDIDVMITAFEALVHRNPVLRSIVRRDYQGYWLETPDSNVLPVVVGCDDPRAFMDRLSVPIDQKTHLAELAIIHGEEEAAVELTVCHNIADRPALTAYFSELWQNYTELAMNGVIADREARPLPNGPEYWLDPNDAPVMPPPLEGEFIQPASIVSGVASIRDRFTLDFSKAATSALREVTKRNGTTVHAAITGAVLIAERHLIDQSGPLPMALRSSVDLRRRLENTIQPFEATALLGQVMTQLHVDRDDSPLAIGRRVVADIHARIADGTAIYSSVQATDAYRPPISYAVNNGVFPHLLTPTDMTIKKIMYGNSEHIEYRALTYRAFTFAGQLHIDMVVPRRAIDRSSRMELAGNIHDALMSIAKKP